MKTLCSVPAKMILSGEHAVIYNRSALSMAVELYTSCECQFQNSSTHSVTIELVDFKQKHSFPFPVLFNLASHIEARYLNYTKNHLSIQGVLVQPIDLVIDTLFHFNDFHKIKFGQWSIKLSSQVPIGKGLGSSASVIVGVLTSLFSQHQLELNKETLLALARKVESRQHGRSSGIDPATMLYGGLLEFHANNTTKSLKPHGFKAWLIDTGKPNSSTGQAVDYVKQHHADNTYLWNQFAEVTQKIIQAWSLQDSQKLTPLIEENQQLLEQIGVVPNRVKVFIKQLKTELNGVAKVCGSGSVAGESAGILLCLSEIEPIALCREYGYTVQPIRIDHKGVQCQII